MTYTKRFLDYHAENQHVYDAFERFTLEAINAGRKRLSSGAVYERMRWESMTRSSNDIYKLNNNYRADHSRMFAERYPQHAGFFSTRARKSKDLA